MATTNLKSRCSDLIALPSVSSTHAALDMSNQATIDLLAEWFEGLGFEIEIQKLLGHDGKANMIARSGPGDDGLVLSGHTDTVPYDEVLWSHDPFKLTEINERWYGLGSTDMKLFFAFIIEAIRDINLKTLRKPLVIVATADEETNMAGAKALVDSGHKLGRYAVIGEPTGLKPIRMHKGMLMYSLQLHGRSGHSSNPAYGNNALEGMHEIIGTLLEWRVDLQSRFHDSAFEVPGPTLNLGHIHGGDNPNRICGDCELQIDLRPLPGMDLDELKRELRQRITPIAQRLGLHLHTESLFDGIPAMATNPDSPLVHACEHICNHASQAVAFGTEGPFMNQMGMDSIILGPGDIAQAHQPDEFLALDRIPPMIKILQQLIHKFCINPE